MKNAGQKEFKAFEFGGNKEGDLGCMQVGLAAVDIGRYNSQHPDKKIPLPDR